MCEENIAYSFAVWVSEGRGCLPRDPFRQRPFNLLPVGGYLVAPIGDGIHEDVAIGHDRQLVRLVAEARSDGVDPVPLPSLLLYRSAQAPSFGSTDRFDPSPPTSISTKSYSAKRLDRKRVDVARPPHQAVTPSDLRSIA
jgi:hypothetical protein